jgi:hypothetical protein
VETKKRNKWLSKIIVIVLIVGCVAVYFCVPSVNKLMNRIFAAFASGDFTVVKEFVASYGAYAAAVSFALMILQSVAAPLPAFLITFANANLFGWWTGSDSFLVKCDGRSSALLLYRKNFGKRCS